MRETARGGMEMDMLTLDSIKRTYDIPCRHNITAASRHILLICHDLGENMEKNTVEAMVSSAQSDGISALAFDFPAHGRSGVGNAQLTVQNCIEDLNAVYDFAKKTAPDAEISLAGMGMGATIALLWMSQQNKRGGRTVKNMVLCGATVCMYSTLMKMCGGEEGAERWRRSGQLTVNDGKTPRLPYGLLKDFEKNDAFQLFRKGKENYLFLHGSEDDVALPEDVRRFTHLYHLNLIELPGAGHFFDAPGDADRLAFEVISYIR